MYTMSTFVPVDGLVISRNNLLFDLSGTKNNNDADIQVRISFFISVTIPSSLPSSASIPSNVLDNQAVTTKQYE